tara:strand:- start:31 stop:336 length:306 start_codon:yes stop_codon:yes gene_type:complete
MIQFVDMNEDGDMVVTNEDSSRLVLLTTLWFTETTMVDGTPFTPEPEVHMVSWTDELRQLAEVEYRVKKHNDWASEQEGRPVVKFAKQQVVLITPTTTELV